MDMKSKLEQQQRSLRWLLIATLMSGLTHIAAIILTIKLSGAH